jgi:thiosulfate/3-mercaptopyruvate sulfurtransferase
MNHVHPAAGSICPASPISELCGVELEADMKLRVPTAIIFIVLFCAVISQAAPLAAANMVVKSDWLAAHSKDANLVILHAGMDRTTYDAGHVPGARFVALSDITITRNGIPFELPPATDLKAAFERLGVGDNSRVVVYGDHPMLAGRVYFSLDYLGRADQTAVLDGALEKWKAEKRPLDTARPEVKPAKLTVKTRPQVVLDFAAVQKTVAAKKPVLIDSRAPEEFSGTKPGDGVKRGGHIPGAKSVPWIQALVSKENPVLKPTADIRALYQAAGVTPGKDVVVYCRTGLLATHAYFTLKLAGFRPMMYDGSFFEWSNTPGTQVETGVAR